MQCLRGVPGWLGGLQPLLAAAGAATVPAHLPTDAARRRDFTLPIAHQRWIEGCQAHHSARAGWNYHYWDYTAAEVCVFV